MMKLKLSEILNLKPIVEHLIEQPIPIDIAYNLSNLYNNIVEHVTLFNHFKTQMLKRLGDIDSSFDNSENATYSIDKDSENIDEYNRLLNQLLNTDLELFFTKFDIKDLIVEVPKEYIELIKPILL